MGEKRESLHVVVLPCTFFSHLNPFFELSKSIAQMGHHVSFICTEPKIQTLEARARAHQSASPSLRLVPFPGEDPDAFQEPLAGFLRTASPAVDWILYDIFPHWISRVASPFGAKCVNVCVVSAAANASMWPVMSERSTPSVERLTAPHGAPVAFRPHEALHIIGQMFAPDSSGISMADRIWLCMSAADAVAVRSSVELEGEWLDVLAGLSRKPVLALGHLPPDAASWDAVDGAGILGWLDAEKNLAGSVLYVAFGSELILSPAQVEELAHGIEISGVPFIWALRCQNEGPNGLPVGFEERTEGHGLVCKGWVPQVKILAHSAIGGFTTHCGWNSVLEALQFGVPLVTLPLAHDEFLNARLITDRNFGVEVPRNEVDGSFDRYGVAKAIKWVMLDVGGEGVRDRAKEVKGVFGRKEFHDRYVREFVGYLSENKNARE